MRKYAEAWEELRDKQRLEIVSPRSWHARIHNGIRKERYKDLLHSLYLLENKLTERVQYTRRGDTMIYVLLRRKDLELNNLSLKDLF